MVMVAARSTRALEHIVSTNSHADEVKHVQATLGRGPGIDALELGTPVLVKDRERR